MSLMTIAAVVTLSIGATGAYFSDTEAVNGNTFSAGVLDLVLEHGNAVVPITITDITPGHTYGSQTYSATNNGTIPGVFSLKVKNLQSLENGVTEPERKAGDSAGVRLDPDGFTNATGDGELLDQVTMKFWASRTAGQRPSPSDWQDISYGGIYPDESSYYSLPLNTNLFEGNNIVLQPGETIYFGVVTSFLDDTNVPYSWILDGTPNNAAMSDSINFDLELGLKQL